MRKTSILAIIMVVPLFCLSQNIYSKFRAKSWQTFAYRINAAEADQFIKWDSIPVSNFINVIPALVFNADSVDENKLPVGNYVLLTAKGITIEASFISISDLVVLDINNKTKLQIDVRNKVGDFITDVKVFVNNKEAAYKNDSKTFWVNNYLSDEALVKIYSPGDTLFLTLAQKDDYRVIPIAEQRRRNYRSTRIYRYLNWLPSKFRQLFNSRYKKSRRLSASGFIIFNQPKYKPLDTVRFKGYVVNKHGNQYKKNIAVHLTYSDNGIDQDHLIRELSPVSPGAFVGQFVLADTIPSDINCNLVFTTLHQKQIIQNRFAVEDYVLDEIDSYSFKSEKEIYFRNDSLRFFASAKDANGLNVLDARATLLLTTNVINKYYQDTLFVQDTLYNKEVPLLTNGDTKFAIAASDLPKADITIKASLTFKNSNNELHEENEIVSYKYVSREIFVTQNNDSLKAVYIEDGIETPATGEMSFNDEADKPVVFPIRIKIDPVAKDYSFYINDINGKAIVSQFFDVEQNYKLNFSRISNGDTLGFVLSNPYKIPVYFTVFFGNKAIATGKQSDALVSWKKTMSNHRIAYKVRWQYIWAGEEKQGEETIGLLYKLLNIKISSDASVYPGRKDSIRIDVKDYKGNAASDVNLTAVSYNNQFSNAIKVQEPPYIAKYKNKRYLTRQGYESDEDESLLFRTYLLGKNTAWINKFHLDTMAYYKLLFPKENYYDEVTPIDNFIPQVSVNVVSKGVPQEIYLLYINRQLMYYNGITDSMKYSFEVYPDNVQIGIRLKDKFIEIDSLYMQPNYKHDLSFDLNNLPQHSKIMKAEKYWSYDEMNLLESSMLKLRNDYQNNDAYIWQHHKVVHLSGNKEHVSGPFKRDSITFLNPGNFDITYNFEPGYETSFSKQIVRLEKQPLFPRRDLKNILHAADHPALILGDTIVATPVIYYPSLEKQIILQISNQNEYNFFSNCKPGKGALQFTRSKDSVLSYYILEPSDTNNKRIIMPGNYELKFTNINPGGYSLLLVTYKNYVARVNNILIKPGGTTCVKADSVGFTKDTLILKKIAEEGAYKALLVPVTKKEPKKIQSALNNIVFIENGNSVVTGTIIDKKGKNPLAFASINLKSYNKAIFSDGSGNFVLKGVRAGKYKLIVNCVGYETKEVEINIGANENIKLNILLNFSSQALQEVVVIGYSSVTRKELTGSLAYIDGSKLQLESQMLQGRAAGLTVSGVPGSSSQISLRGITSNISDNTPLYVVDGILYDELPSNLDQSIIQNITLLKDASAVAIYGARAVNGVVIVTTKTTGIRKQFHDYALWQPNFFTDKNGHASIGITYPDNVTGWKTFVVAMDKERRIGKASILTQAYKPMIAELSMPQFLIDGDTVNIIGKSKNYTTDKYTVTNEFTVDENIISLKEKALLPNDANIESLKITNKYADTLKASYTLKSSTGFNDGEERKIPVFKKGTEEAVGNFWILHNDTSVSFTALPGTDQLNIYAQNNTLDLLLEELEHLRKYPFYCMEQIASKLTGLAAEKKIREQLKQPFNNQKEFDRLLQKIEKAQLFDGGWPWWENGKPNFYITNYITNALLQFREDQLIENNIRNAFLYLQNQLPSLKTNDLLEALFTLSNGKHEMDYTQWINKINYDSLSQHQQWQLICIKQQQKLNYQDELKKLVDKGTSTMLGGLHWGIENYSWQSNEIATTVLAYKVLKNERAYTNTSNSIIQYFLEKRHKGFWNNTVESATIVNAILPQILSQQKDFIKPATITIAGDTSILISSFPYKMQSNSDRIRNINISKTGGGLIYLTAYQQIFNTQPKAVEDKFIIKTYFQKNNETLADIKAGERIKMIVSVNVLKDADYVQMEIPIPAGCSYASKNSNDWKVYKEFYKNKVMMFTESLTKGMHQFEIELEAGIAVLTH